MMREISRWLKTFDVYLGSEKIARGVASKWVGKGLQNELAPFNSCVQGTVQIEVILKPWSYMYNVVAHVLHRLDELDEENLLVEHLFIPQSEIHVKIGDHKDTSLKMSYQIANVKNPNGKDNTVVFSLFEVKDTRANLRCCLSRFKAQIEMLQKIQWREEKIRVFMFGDYEFLCAMCYIEVLYRDRQRHVYSSSVLNKEKVLFSLDIIYTYKTIMVS